jgi:hypothetical protein
MDILTTKGRKTVEQEQEAIKIWNSKYPSIIYNETPKKKPADIDAILINEKKEIVGVVETKCRVSMSLDKFYNFYSGKWLVTFEKIMKAVSVSKSIYVPLVGFLYFPDEKTLLVQKIFDPENGFCVAFDVRHTETQASVNGGLIYRDNAYIDMNKSKVLK